MADVAHLYRVVQDQRTGSVLTGVSVKVCDPGTTVAIADSLYADEALSVPLANPFTTANGIIDFYLPEARNVAIQTTYGSDSNLADNIAVLPRAEFLLATPVQVQILNGPGTNTVLVGIDANTAQFSPLDATLLTKRNAITGWALSGAYALINTTRDSNGALTSANVMWPDGITGIFTADVISSLSPGKVDGYHVTYDNPVQYTITQPTMTRDANGNITAQPMLLVVP